MTVSEICQEMAKRTGVDTDTPACDACRRYQTLHGTGRDWAWAETWTLNTGASE